MLDSNGFHKKTYSELLDEMEAKAKELFGEDTRLASDGFMGVFLKLFAWFLSIVWELAERVYYSAFLSSAEGVQLDRYGSDKGIYRDIAVESYVTLNFTGIPNFLIPMEKQFSTESNIYFMLIENVQMDANGSGSGQAVCMAKGVIGNAAPNTITMQAEPIEEITSVTNLEFATGGDDAETDDQYRARIRQNNQGSGKSIPDAVLSALLNTTGVRSSSVIWNKTDVVDGDGNLPHSVHAYVLGGNPDDVAQALFNSVAGGIAFNGQTAVTVYDVAGNPHEVRFDFATEVPIYVNLTITTDTDFAADGVSQLQNSIIDKVGRQMGKPVIYSQLFNAVYQIIGIDDVTILISRDPAALSNINIAIAPREVAQATIDTIEVVMNGAS